LCLENAQSVGKGSLVETMLATRIKRPQEFGYPILKRLKL